MYVGGTSANYSDGGPSRTGDTGILDCPNRIYKPRIIETNSPSGLHNNNNDILPQMLSTFVQQGGTHTMNFAHIDGDLV